MCPFSISLAREWVSVSSKFTEEHPGFNMCILSLFALSISVLSVVTVADSVPQLGDLLSQNNLDSTIAFNSDSPHNEITKPDFTTNPTDLFGSSADPKDLTESTDNAQISSFFSNDLATLITYDPNAPSNPNGSPNSDATPLSPDKTLSGTTEEDPKIAQEVVNPLEEVIPETIPIPGGTRSYNPVIGRI